MPESYPVKQLSDLTEPAVITRKLLERDIQETCVRWARERGWWARKFASQSNRSVPDYIFSKYTAPSYGVQFAVEFKAPGKTSTEAQQYEQKLMREAGWIVREFDNVDMFKQLVLTLDPHQYYPSAHA